ncbi:hypothetical protein [Nocardia thailandica]|uniref:hypothetical protein n=1 Tax=Nocardia thailandica TaxID=257275 RepID=UPI0003022217|nr:hypothetical protein [Nocardia thailandica]
MSAEFAVGDKVRKVTGDYHWSGVVCAVFDTPAGKRRYVVGHSVDTGWVLHIYGPANLAAEATDGVTE